MSTSISCRMNDKVCSEIYIEGKFFERHIIIMGTLNIPCSRWSAWLSMLIIPKTTLYKFN